MRSAFSDPPRSDERGEQLCVWRSSGSGGRTRVSSQLSQLLPIVRMSDLGGSDCASCPAGEFRALAACRAESSHRCEDRVQDHTRALTIDPQHARSGSTTGDAPHGDRHPDWNRNRTVGTADESSDECGPRRTTAASVVRARPCDVHTGVHTRVHTRGAHCQPRVASRSAPRHIHHPTQHEERADVQGGGPLTHSATPPCLRSRSEASMPPVPL